MEKEVPRKFVPFPFLIKKVPIIYIFDNEEQFKYRKTYITYIPSLFLFTRKPILVIFGLQKYRDIIFSKYTTLIPKKIYNTY
jgi:hypothetical protein